MSMIQQIQRRTPLGWLQLKRERGRLTGMATIRVKLYHDRLKSNI